ncbi:MAG: hypothetical protein WEA58_04080 [Balneolaceae bacterium]
MSQNEAIVSCLHLTLSKKPFEVMVTGEKKEEFRKNSEWIRSRLFDSDRIMERVYTHIKFVNGYGSDKPYFICEFDGFMECYMDVEPREYSNELIVDEIGKGDFIIYCGEIMGIGNWPKEK